MHLLAVGMDHRIAPLQLRERCTWPAEALSAPLQALRCPELVEAALLCTCNRTEVYGVAADPAAAVAHAAEVLAARAGWAAAELRAHLYVLVGAEDVLRHLCRVACGLESLVLGETQVLAQVKEAYQRSAEAGTVGRLLHGLFHQALFCSKRVHAETALAAASTSIGAAAVELARAALGDLSTRSAVLLGAGATADIVARRLREAGLPRIDVVNRTRDRAAGLAAAVGGTGWPMAELAAAIAGADVLVTSTAAPGMLVRPEHIAPRPAGRPLLIVDIAVPRDVDPEVGLLPGVHLRNIDDLEAVVAGGRSERAGEAAAAEAIIAAELGHFQVWLGSLSTAPLLRALSERMEAVASEQAEATLRRLPGLAEPERELVRRLARSVARKLLDAPLRRARALGASPGAQDRVQALSDLFGVDPPRMVSLPGEGGARRHA